MAVKSLIKSYTSWKMGVNKERSDIVFFGFPTTVVLVVSHGVQIWG